MVSTRDPAVIPELRSTPGLKVVSFRLLGVNQLTLRLGPGGHPALRSKLVRRALAYGIDRGAIARTVFGVIDPRYPASESAVLWNSHRSYRPNWDIYRYRPALARRLLEQAGCQRGADGIYVCAGQRLSLRLSARAGLPFRTRTVELIGRHLRQVGIEVVISYSAFATFGQRDPRRAARSTWPSSPGSQLRSHRGRGLWLRRSLQLHGVLPAARHCRPRTRPTGSSMRSSVPASSTAPTAGWRRTCP